MLAMHQPEVVFPVTSLTETAMNGLSDGSRSAAESELLELALMLPSWQLFALDDLARKRGLNVGQLLRRLIGNMLQQVADRGL